MDYEKSIKNAKWFAIGIFVLQLIMFCFRLSNGATTSLSLIIGIAQLVLIFATIKGLNDEKVYGAICGIIMSILIIINFNIINLIFGILYLIDCIKLVSYLKNN